MKDKKTFGVHGRNKNRRKTGKYTDEYIEDLYEEYEESLYEEENPTQETDAVAEDDFDEEDEYIVAYSSENAIVGAYTSDEMQEYAKEYEEAQEHASYE